MCFNPQPDRCTCCKWHLHHCETCWDKYHNGQKHKDYIPPEFRGQGIHSDKFYEEMSKILEKEFKRPVPEEKQKPYKEGEYNH